MKNLVMNVVAYKEDYRTSPQIGNNCSSLIMGYYLKNAFVCLKSCLKNTKDLDAVLFVNFDMDEFYKKLFEENAIRIIKLPFEDFLYPKEFDWAITNYKLCCFKWAVINLDYDRFLILDTDVYCVDDLTDLFAEMQYGVMMHNIGHRLSHRDRREIIDATHIFFGETVDVVHYGGECIGGTKENLLRFVEMCSDVYEKTYNAVVEGGIHKFSDEFIISMAAHCVNVRQAVPYIFRYWTIKDFFLICTNWKYNSVLLWHLPVEKKRGMFKLYDYYMKKGCFPPVDKAAAMMGFGRTTRPFVLSDYRMKAKNFMERALHKSGK